MSIAVNINHNEEPVSISKKGITRSILIMISKAFVLALFII